MSFGERFRTLDDVLQNEQDLSLLRQYMKKSYCDENLDVQSLFYTILHLFTMY